MEIISIDFFIIPDESVEVFREKSQKIQSFIRTIPGFVEGYFFEKKDGGSEYNFVTMAVWKSREVLGNAGKALWAEFERQGFNPQELFNKLKVERIHSEYERSPY